MSSPACATTASLLLVLVAVCAPLTSSAGALVVSGRPSRGLLDGAVRLLSSVLATQSCATPAQSAGCVIGSTGGGDDGDLVAAYGRNLQRPECAISMLDLGVEPVVASDGYTYRLSPLMTWCARFDYGSCTSPLTRETIRPEVYYNQDLEVVMNTWGDQVRRKRHGTTMSWVQRFCADTVVICPDGRSYTEEEAHKFKLRWCYLNRALKKVAMEVAALDVLSVQQQQDLEPVAERMARRSSVHLPAPTGCRSWNDVYVHRETHERDAFLDYLIP